MKLILVSPIFTFFFIFVGILPAQACKKMPVDAAAKKIKAALEMVHDQKLVSANEEPVTVTTFSDFVVLAYRFKTLQFSVSLDTSCGYSASLVKGLLTE
jgi:hypothetical protein